MVVMLDKKPFEMMPVGQTHLLLPPANSVGVAFKNPPSLVARMGSDELEEAF